jgi:hypothetical protein
MKNKINFITNAMSINFWGFGSFLAIINLGFNKGDNSLTTHIFYYSVGTKNTVIFFEANINSQGTLSNCIAYHVNSDGSLGENISRQTENFWACWGAGCIGCLVGCIGSNCGYMGCLAACCGGAGLGCAAYALLSGD